MSENQVTRVLFVEEDELSFQFSKCIADVIPDLKSVQLSYASDATEALSLLEREKFDVVVINEENRGEKNLLLDGLGVNHPTILIQSEEVEFKVDNLNQDPNKDNVIKIPMIESVDAVKQTLLLASQFSQPKAEPTTKLKVLH